MKPETASPETASPETASPETASPETASPETASPETSAIRQMPVERYEAGEARVEPDWVAVEEPLEIRVCGESLVVTLRAPGRDRELAAGFLFSEGIVTAPEDLVAVETCADPMAYDPDNVIDVELSAEAASRREALDHARREYLSAAACGLCGKARIEAIYQRLPEPSEAKTTWDRELLCDLPRRMESRQDLFAKTGGLHAAALFNPEGELLDLAEDVGRHNAVDKLIGASLLRGDLPWTDRVLVVSARAGFEIVQKALMARASAMVAVGAASSLAVEAAQRGGMELHSFVRGGRSNRHLGSGRRTGA